MSAEAACSHLHGNPSSSSLEHVENFGWVPSLGLGRVADELRVANSV